MDFTLERQVLVTGGAGFIGSHLAEALLARGDSVTVVDDVSTGAMENLSAILDHDLSPKLLKVHEPLHF